MYRRGRAIRVRTQWASKEGRTTGKALSGLLGRSHSKSQSIQCPVAPPVLQVIPAVQSGYSGPEQYFENNEYSIFLLKNWK